MVNYIRLIFYFVSCLYVKTFVFSYKEKNRLIIYFGFNIILIKIYSKIYHVHIFLKQSRRNPIHIEF